jgi:hypothetical protein
VCPSTMSHLWQFKVNCDKHALNFRRCSQIYDMMMCLCVLTGVSVCRQRGIDDDLINLRLGLSKMFIGRYTFLLALNNVKLLKLLLIYKFRMQLKKG